MFYKEILPEQYTIKPIKISKTWNLTFSDVNSKFFAYNCVNDPDKIISIDVTSTDLKYNSIDFNLYNKYLSKSDINNIFVLEISDEFFGEGIKRNSFIIDHLYNSKITELPYSSSNEVLINDNDQDLYDSNNTNFSGSLGKIFHEHGIIVITDFEYYKYFKSVLIDNSGSAEISMGFDSEVTIYSNEINVLIKSTDFNETINPTAYSGSVRLFQDNDEFAPYITTIGYYDEFGKCVMITKLAKPLKMEKDLDSIFVVKFDT
jgi:hypothetical protein